MGFIDMLLGSGKKAIIEMGQKAHTMRFPAKEEGKVARKMVNELALENKYRRKFVNAMKAHLSAEVIKDEKEAERHIKIIIDCLATSLKDDLMIAHMMIQAISEFVKDDKEIPHAIAQHLVEDSLHLLEGTKKMLFSYSNALRQMSQEGGN